MYRSRRYILIRCRGLRWIQDFKEGDSRYDTLELSKNIFKIEVLVYGISGILRLGSVL